MQARSQTQLLTKIQEYLILLDQANENLNANEKKNYSFLYDRPSHFLNTLPFKLPLKKGTGFGMALCHGAMRIAGKLAWWESALNSLIDWDGQLDSLNNEVLLPGANENKPLQLHVLFERIINAIFFNQLLLDEKMVFENIANQIKLIEPGGDFLVLNENNEKLTIQEMYKMVGSFSEEMLIKSLDNPLFLKAIEHNICLIASQTQTCELSYASGQWFFYDPIEPLVFNHCKDLVDHIFAKLKNPLAIFLPCVQPLTYHPFSYYQECLENPEKIYDIIGPDGEGLIRISDCYPERYEEILQTLSRSIDLLKLKEILKPIEEFDQERWDRNLETAQQALAYSRKIIPLEGSSTQPIITDKNKLFGISQQIRKVRATKLAINDLLYYFLSFPNKDEAHHILTLKRRSKLFHYGNCHELSALVADYLKKLHFSNVFLFSIKNSDHYFVMMDVDRQLVNFADEVTIDVDMDEAKFGPYSVIIDPLNNIIAPGSQFHEVIKCYEFSPNLENPHILTPFSKNNALTIYQDFHLTVNPEQNHADVEQYLTFINIICSSARVLVDSDEFAELQKIIISENEMFDELEPETINSMTNYEIHQLLNKKLKKILTATIFTDNEEKHKKIYLEILLQSATFLYQDDAFKKIFSIKSHAPHLLDILKHIFSNHDLVHMNLQNGVQKNILWLFSICNLQEQSNYLLKIAKDANLMLDGKTLFYHAVERNLYSAVKHMLKLNTDLNFTETNHYHQNILHFCLLNNSKKMFQILLNHIKQNQDLDYLFSMEDVAGDTFLIRAIRMQRLEFIELLAQTPCIVRALFTGNRDGDYPIHIAIKYDMEILKTLIYHTLPYHHDLLNLQDANGYTPLHLTIKFHCVEATELLLSAGADPTIKTKERETLFIVAMRENNLKAAQLLLNFSKINLLNVYMGGGNLPIHLAAHYQNIDFMKLILSSTKSATINQQNTHGWTPLHFAVFNNNKKLVELLLKNGADQTIQNKSFHSPLDLARQANNLNMVSFLENFNLEPPLKKIRKR